MSVIKESIDTFEEIEENSYDEQQTSDSEYITEKVSHEYVFNF